MTEADEVNAALDRFRGALTRVGAGRRVPAWQVAEPGYRGQKYVVVRGDLLASDRQFCQVDRLTPIWVAR